MNYCFQWICVDANILKTMTRKTENKKIVFVRVDGALNVLFYLFLIQEGGDRFEFVFANSNGQILHSSSLICK